LIFNYLVAVPHRFVKHFVIYQNDLV